MERDRLAEEECRARIGYGGLSAFCDVAAPCRRLPLLPTGETLRFRDYRVNLTYAEMRKIG